MISSEQLLLDVRNELVDKGDVFKNEKDEYIMFNGEYFVDYDKQNLATTLGYLLAVEDNWEFVTREVLY